MPRLGFLALVVIALTAVTARAQTPPTKPHYIGKRQLEIPIVTSPGATGIKSYNLYYSTDQGRTWVDSSKVPPDIKKFKFETPSDGEYWFAVQVTMVDGSSIPENTAEITSPLRLVIDTQAPTVQLQALSPRNGELGVGWSIRDDNLDLNVSTVSLQWRLAGSSTWQNLPWDPATNQLYWNPRSNAGVEVRLNVVDRAGNRGMATTNFAPGGAPAGSGAGMPVAQPGKRPGPRNLRFVNSRAIALNVDLDNVGRSGVKNIELYFTTDGRAWQQHPDKFGEGQIGDRKSCNIEVPVQEDGVYGITLIPRSGVGFGPRPPLPGDEPDVWVEVDTVRPAVDIINVTVGSGVDHGKLFLSWSASDKNMPNTTKPIRLSYSTKPDGEWKEFAKDLPNTGKYTWDMSKQNAEPDFPFQFYVRVEAVDQAGNVGSAVTREMVRVDLSIPKAKINSVGPGTNGP